MPSTNCVSGSRARPTGACSPSSRRLTRKSLSTATPLSPSSTASPSRPYRSETGGWSPIHSRPPRPSATICSSGQHRLQRPNAPPHHACTCTGSRQPASSLDRRARRRATPARVAQNHEGRPTDRSSRGGFRSKPAAGWSTSSSPVSASATKMASAVSLDARPAGVRYTRDNAASSTEKRSLSGLRGILRPSNRGGRRARASMRSVALKLGAL